GGRASPQWSLRQRERDRRSVPRLTLDPDPPAVQLHELAREREAEAGTLVLLGVIGAHLPELLEHRVEVLLGDADARIGHRDLDVTAQALRADLHPPAVRRSPHGV